MSDLASVIVNTPVADESSEAPVVSPNEAAPIAPEQKPAEDVDFSNRFAALSRKEKYLQEEAQKIKDSESKYKKYQDLESQAKENPLLVLEKYGIDLDAVIAASLGDEAPPKSVEEQLNALKEEMANDKKKAAEQAAKAEEERQKAIQADIDEAVLVHKNEITDHLSKNVEKYELINLQNAQDLVWEVTEAHYNANNGEILTPEQASDKVETYLEEQIKSAMKLARFNKQEEQKETTGFEIKTVDPIKPVSPTLTSSLANPAPEKSSSPTLSHEESRRAAATLLKWN